MHQDPNSIFCSMFISFVGLEKIKFSLTLLVKDILKVFHPFLEKNILKELVLPFSGKNILRVLLPDHMKMQMPHGVKGPVKTFSNIFKIRTL